MNDPAASISEGTGDLTKPASFTSGVTTHQVECFVHSYLEPLRNYALCLFDDNARFAWAGQGLRMLPFQYLAYFPAAVFLGKIHGWNLFYGLLQEAGWALVLVITARLLFRRGLKQYSAYGG